MRLTPIVCSTLCLMLYASQAGAQQAEEGSFNVIDLGSGLYFMEGPGGLENSGGNVGVSVGEDGIFIIDDQFAPRSPLLLRTLRELQDAPLKFVINSHFHYDHTDGNENLGAGGAVIVAHENARTRMSMDSLIEAMNRPQPAYDPEGLPVITFAEDVTFHLNGETVHVFHAGPAHTDGDAIIHFVEANVIHTGDVFVRYGLPFVDVPNGGSVSGMIEAVHTILDLCDEDTVLIPGHGLPAGKADLEAYVQMLETIRDRVQDGMQAGQSLQEIIATMPVRGYSEAGFVNNASFTTWVWDSLWNDDPGH